MTIALRLWAYPPTDLSSILGPRYGPALPRISCLLQIGVVPVTQSPSLHVGRRCHASQPEPGTAWSVASFFLESGDEITLTLSQGEKQRAAWTGRWEGADRLVWTGALPVQVSCTGWLQLEKQRDLSPGPLATTFSE